MTMNSDEYAEESDRLAEKLYHRYGRTISSEEDFKKAYKQFWDATPQGLTARRTIWRKQVFESYQEKGFLRKGEEFKERLEKVIGPKPTKEFQLLGKEKGRRGYIRAKYDEVEYETKKGKVKVQRLRGTDGRFVSQATPLKSRKRRR